MRCPYCQNRFSEKELSYILERRGNFIKCKCKESIHYSDFFQFYTSDNTALNESNFIDLMEDLISLNILKKNKESGVVSLKESNINTSILEEPLDENFNHIQLAVEIIKFTLSKYYTDINYAPYVIDLLLLSVKMDFISFGISRDILRKENKKMDEKIKERYLKAIEISLDYASRKLAWLSKNKLDSNGKFNISTPGTEFIEFLGFGFGHIASPLHESLEFADALSFIQTWREALQEEKNKKDNLLQKMMKIWKK